MLAGNRGLNLFQEAGVDQPEERRVLGPGGARRTRAKGRGGRERARDSGAVAALPESGASRFASSWGAGGGAGGPVSGAGPAGSRTLASPRGSALVGLDPGAGPVPAAGTPGGRGRGRAAAAGAARGGWVGPGAAEWSGFAPRCFRTPATGLVLPVGGRAEASGRAGR